jgi:DNA polymerase III sliding clamp (beta) subunit (PCNA family)
MTINKDDLINVFEILASLQDEQPTSFEVSEEGLHTRLMDPTHVSLLDLGIMPSEFLKFETQGKNYFTIPNTKQTLKKLKALDNDESITLYYTNKKLYIQNSETKFTLTNTDDTPSDQVLPNIGFDSILEFKELKALQKQHKKIESLGYDYVTYHSKPNELLLSATQDNDEIQMTHSVNTIRNNDECKSMYSLDYLNPFLQSLDQNFKVELKYSTNRPCLYHVTLGTNIRLDYWVAPRMEN